MTTKKQNPDKNKLREKIKKELTTIYPENEYYALTLLGTSDGRIQHGAYTHWVGWVDDKPGREIRQASIVNAERLAETWRDLGENCIVVNNTFGVMMFLQNGGNALVKKELAEKHMKYMVVPDETAFDGSLGFKSLKNIPVQAFKRATRPKQRMRIIKRDLYRCRICGRNPDNHTDIELHVHHIRPWSKGGLTEDDNLITLCDTCHNGLEPHEEHSLFSYIEQDKLALKKDIRNKEFLEGVRIYRVIVQKDLAEID
ncbi:HNH endonuclease [Candidatus Latescibacterota bacterium]